MIPIKDTILRRTYPYATLLIIIVNLLVFALELSLPPRIRNDFIYVFGLVPARYSHHHWAHLLGVHLDAYWPFITNLFLHGGWLHIIGNMWFLYLFGDNVEDRLGHCRFLFFYLLAGVAANLIHFFVNQDSTMPVIGASGAIAGVMAAYLRLFPRARIVTLFPVLFFPFFFEVPAFLFMGFWFLMQLFSGAVSLAVANTGEGIAWWAHIGGFGVGFFLIKRLCRWKRGGCSTGEMYDSVYR
jgi:membrane associated rhomboid family serine protease